VTTRKRTREIETERGKMHAATVSIRQRALAPEAAPVLPPLPSVDNLRDRLWVLAEEWGAQGWPWMERLLKGATALSKSEH
jgi:hypothetical protein